MIYNPNEKPWTDEDQELAEAARQREVMAYIYGVNSIIRRTPIYWTESEAQHALKAILTCLTATYHLQVTKGEVGNVWINCVDEAIDSLADDEGLSL